MLWGLRQGSSSPLPCARLGTPRGAGAGRAGQPRGLILAMLCPYRSSRSRRSWWPWGRVSSSMPELTPMSRCISTVTPNIRATWQGR